MKKLMIMLSAAVATMATVTFAEPSVEITKVRIADARDGTAEYAYTVGGDFEGWNYDLIVKVSADDGTKSAVLTNEDVTAGATMKTVNVKALLGKAYPSVSLFTVLRKQPAGVRLWAGGPHFAECNVGATEPEEYGILTNFNDAAKAVTAAMGDGWRLRGGVRRHCDAGREGQAHRGCSRQVEFVCRARREDDRLAG